MEPLAAMAMVSDRLVGGMMHHQDNADLNEFLGMTGFARLHEMGFLDDSRSLRKVRRKTIDHLGRIPLQGNQERGDTLSKVIAYKSSDLGANDRYRLAVTSLEEWEKWERETALVFGDAAKSLDGTLWKLVTRLQRGAEGEHAEAHRLLLEAKACDLAHLYDMQR